jgi:probable addiction module antidote protein
MDKTKTSKKRKKLPKKSTGKTMRINGVELLSHDPSAIFKNHKEIRRALFESLMDGDREAFVDILSGYVRAHNILEVCRRTGLSRTVVYGAISENGNPSLDTLCKIMTSFKKVA